MSDTVFEEWSVCQVCPLRQEPGRFALARWFDDTRYVILAVGSREACRAALRLLAEPRP